jgi:hypothetical protein
MSIREDITKIIKSNSCVDKSTLIIQYLEDKHFGLNKDGLLKDDDIIISQLDSRDVVSELKHILEKVDGKICKSATSQLNGHLEVFNNSSIEHIVYEGTGHGYKLYSPNNDFNTALSEPHAYPELIKAIKHKALMDIEYKAEDTGYFTSESGQSFVVFTKPAPYGGIVHIKLKNK